jgi:hypothetical protein
MRIPLLSMAAVAASVLVTLIRAALFRIAGRESADTAKTAYYL